MERDFTENHTYFAETVGFLSLSERWGATPRFKMWKLEARASKGPAHGQCKFGTAKCSYSLAMYQKHKALVMNEENVAKPYSIESKIVNSLSGGRLKKTRGENMKVSLAMLLKTHVEKMTENQSLTMLMKPKELKLASGDVDENKGAYCRRTLDEGLGVQYGGLGYIGGMILLSCRDMLQCCQPERECAKRLELRRLDAALPSIPRSGMRKVKRRRRAPAVQGAFGTALFHHPAQEH